MTLRRALISTVLAVVVLTGCGSAGKVSPQAAVRDAAQSTASQKEGTFTLSLVGSDADINALFNEGAPLSDDDREGLRLLRNGHVALSTANDKFGLDVKAGDVDHAVEVRYIDEKLYARADVAGLATLFGTSPQQVADASRGMAAQDGLGFLSAAAAGKWIVADFSTLKDLFGGAGKQFGVGSGQGSTPAPTADPKAATQYKAIRDAIDQALREDVTVDKVNSDATGDHYVAKVASLRNFYAKVRPGFEQQLSSLPYAKALPSADAVPDKPGTVDVWVKSGRVSRLELDLAQLAPAPPAGGGRVALRLDVARDAAAITVPSDAVPVDLAALLGKFVSRFGGLLQSGARHYD